MDQNPAQPIPPQQPSSSSVTPASPTSPVGPTPPVTPQPGAPAPQPTPQPQGPQPPVPTVSPMAGSVPPAGEYESNPFKLFGPSWQAIKLNLGPFVKGWLATIGAIALPSVIYLLLLSLTAAMSSKSSDSSSPVGPILALVVGLVVVVFGFYFVARCFAGLQYLLLASAKGEKHGFGDAYKAAKPFVWRLIGYGFLFAILVIGGFLLFIIPGILFTVWYSLGGFAIIEENLGVGAALSRSKQLVSGRFWDMFGMQSVPSLFNFLSIIPFLGPIVAFLLTIAYTAATPQRYLALKDYKDNNKPFPATSKLNFLAPLIFVVAIPLSFIPAYNDVKNSTNKDTNTETYQLDSSSTDGSSSSTFDDSSSMDSSSDSSTGAQ